MRRASSAILLAAALIVGTLALPASAQAQYRGGVRVSVGVGYGYGHPWMYGQWGPWGPWGPYYGYGWYGPWGPWGPYAPYGWGYYNATGFVSSLKLQAATKEFKDTEVYVDGGRAGTVGERGVGSWR